MKFVFASERGKLLRERQNYIDTYNTKKSTYEAQVKKYKEDTEGYTDNMKGFVTAFLSAEIAQLPGLDLKVKEASSTPLDERYYIYMYYRSSKRSKQQDKWTSGNYTYDVDSGRLKGLNWSFSIYIQSERQEDGSFARVVKKNPIIEANVLDSNDYFELKATYDLFAKIDTIDWDSVISHICNSAPKKEEIITEPNPGYFSTQDWDTKIAQYEINRIIGKELWLKVKINREESYDRYNSNNPGVDGDGWVMILSQTDKFYFFHWIPSRYDDEEAPRYTKYKIERALEETYRLKKVYFKPTHPVQYATTKDLTEVQKPDYLGDISIDDD